MSNIDAIRQERKDIFNNTVKHTNHDRILNMSLVYAWMVYDAKLKLSVAARDYDMRLKMVEDFHLRYDFDMYLDLWTRNPLLVSDALGSNYYEINDETYGTVNKYVSFMEPEDYELMRTDYKKFIWTKVMPRKFVNINDGNVDEIFQKAIQEAQRYQQYVADSGKLITEKCGALYSPTTGVFFFDVIATTLRGLQGTALDIRRVKDEVIATCDAMGVLGLKAFGNMIEAGTLDPLYIKFVMLGHTILNPKQFEDFYWPQLKQVYEFAVKYDQTFFLFLEGENTRLYDYLREAPKGHFIFHFESDDIFAAKKALPNAAIAGGMPTELLGRGSVGENVKYAHRLLDEFGADGSFIFSQDKMLVYPSDATRENLLAVNEVVRNHRL